MSTFVRLSSLSFLFVALLSSITGCSSSDNDSADVQRSCFDLGDAVIDAYTRCGAERQETYDAYYAEAGTNCSRVVQIRDENQLRRSCLPDLRTISCSQLMGGLPYSCHEQLLTQSTDLHGGSLEPSAVSASGGPFSSLMGNASGELHTEP